MFGIFIAEIGGAETPEVKAKNFSRDANLSEDLLKNLAGRCTEASGKSCIILGEDFKVVGVSLNLPNIYAGFLLNKNEDSAQVFVNIEEKEKKLTGALKAGNEGSTLDEMLQFEEEVSQKLTDPKLLKDKIIAQTNVLLDRGDFEKAKGLISLAEEVPAKLTDAVAQAEQARIEGNFKLAEKQYRIAADHASTIDEDHLREVLLAKMERVKQIPNFIKRQTANINKLQKPMADQNYDALTSLVSETIILSDKLEDDEIIPDLRSLSEIAFEAAELKKRLEDKDQKMREILDKIVSKRAE